MMLNKAFSHLYTLGNNIYTRKYSPTNIYVNIENSNNIRKMCETYSKFRIKTPERRHAVFILNFEYILHFFLVIVLTLNK